MNRFILVPKTQHESGIKSHHWIRIGFWFCIIIAVAAVLRRLIALSYPSQTGHPGIENLDAVFESHIYLTLAHILPSLAFVLLLPLALFRKARVEPILFPLGVVVSITAYAMSATAIGGWTERSAVLAFNTLFLYSLLRAYWCWSRKETEIQRPWLLRAAGILLGIATTRPVMAIFFATSSFTHLVPQQFFGIAFWIGFTINTVLVEIWLHMEVRQSSYIQRGSTHTI